MSYKIRLKDTSFRIYINSLGLYLSPECLLNFLSRIYILPWLGKIFKLIMFLFLENTLNLGIFSDASLSTQNSPMFLSLPPPPLYTPGTGKLLIAHPTHLPPSYAGLFLKYVFPNNKKEWRKLWFTLSKWN